MKNEKDGYEAFKSMVENNQSRPAITEDSLFGQMATITKAHAYDILVEQVKELKRENEILTIKLKASEAILAAYKQFVNDVRPTNAISAELPAPKENDPDDLKGVIPMDEVTSDIENELNRNK